MLSNLAACNSHPSPVGGTGALDSSPDDSDIIGLGHSLGMGIFKTPQV